MKTIVVVHAVLWLPVVVAGFQGVLGQTGNSTAQVALEGSFDLEASADRAFWFFTPEGEKKWVTGWNPEPVYPPQTEVAFQRNAVFRVNDESEQSLWTIVDANLPGHVAEYVYVVEGQRLSRVRVEVRPRGATHSRVSVHYIHTAISEKGVKFVATMTKESFAHKMLNWQRLVSAALSEPNSSARFAACSVLSARIESGHEVAHSGEFAALQAQSKRSGGPCHRRKARRIGANNTGRFRSAHLYPGDLIPV